MKKQENVIKGFKGFDKDLKCRGFQYKEGEEYETDQKPVRCTSSGFHCSCGDIESLFDICEKAKDNADKRLSELSTLALWRRYKQWKKSEPIVGKEEDLFNAFLNQVCFDLGRDALKRS
jgi:hypothetical protein